MDVGNWTRVGFAWFVRSHIVYVWEAHFARFSAIRFFSGSHVLFMRSASTFFNNKLSDFIHYNVNYNIYKIVLKEK